MSEKECYVVFNQTKMGVSFPISPMASLPPVVGLSSHHRRRRTKGTVLHISIPPQMTRDLCKDTGCTVEDLELCEELQSMLASKNLLLVKLGEEELKVQFANQTPEAPKVENVVPPVEAPEEVPPVEVPEEVPPVEVAPVEAPVEVAEEAPPVEVPPVPAEEDVDFLETRPVESVFEHPLKKNKGGRPKMTEAQKKAAAKKRKKR